MTSTYTYTTARVHTATHLSDVIMGALSGLILELGLDHKQLQRTWAVDQQAIKAWILEGSLNMVALECNQPSGRVAPVIEFPVSYDSAGNGDIEFTASRARLARFMNKLASVPAGTTFRLFCSFNGYHSPQPGWSTASRASTTGLSSTTFGTLATAPGATAGMRLYQ